jgi:uncharacterized protein (TIGR02145 family)
MMKFIIVFTSALLIITCQFCIDEDSGMAPYLTTNEVSSIAVYAAFSGGNIESGEEVMSRGVCWSKSPNPTINDNKTFDGSGSGVFSSYIAGLEAGTLYHIRAYAKNSYGIGYGQEISFNSGLEIEPAVFNPDLVYGSVSDVDGNNYRTIQINKQIWMAENLKTTRYNDNTPISKGYKYLTWGEYDEAVFGWYRNDSTSFNAVFGAIYNWHAASSDRLCPVGWHVPTDEEFNVLADNPGGSGGAVAILKEKSFKHWKYPNAGATNKSGFTALPAGILDIVNPGLKEEWSAVGPAGYWWSSSDFNSGNARYISLASEFTGAGKLIISDADKRSGFSVRCLKD